MWSNPVTALLAISSEKISSYYIHKFKVEDVVRDALSVVINKYFRK
jgi:hypothetical protein